MESVIYNNEINNAENDETVYQGEILTENENNKNYDEYLGKQNKKTKRFGDILTMQCIICIIIAIVIVVLNISFPKVCDEVAQKYKAVSVSDEKVNAALVSLVSSISEFLNTAPNDRI